MITTQQFIDKHDGDQVWLLDDPKYGAQCVALFWKYNIEVGKSEAYSAVGAIDLWDKDWLTYENVSTAKAAILGDWCIWSGDFGPYQNYIEALGRGVGHVAMFISDNGNGTGQFFSQNPGPARIMTLSYEGIVGYLRLGVTAVPYFINGLAQAIRDQNTGLKVVEVNGSKTRGYAGRGITKVAGTMWHHTATGRSAFLRSVAPTLSVVTHGHASLPGPLCHILFARDGTVYVVATGWANHAGTGKWTDIPWHRGNDYTIGIEMESSGVAPWDWTDEQKKWAPVLGAVLRKIFAHNNDMSHEEYSDAGKIDPAGWPGDMDGLRRQITEAYNGKGTPAPKPEPEKDWLDMVTQAELEDSLVKVNRRFVGDVVDVPSNYGTEQSRKNNPTWAAQNVWTQIWQNSIEAEKHSKRAAEAAERGNQLLEELPGKLAAAIAAAQSPDTDLGQIPASVEEALLATVAEVRSGLQAQVANLEATITLKAKEL